MIKPDAGTLVLGGANTFTNGSNIWGSAVINKGRLASAVTVRNGVTLGGSGTFSGWVTTTSGAIPRARQ